MTRNWTTITHSRYEHERKGLDFIRHGLPDHDPYRAWSNFEFQADDGAIYEVDLLVLTKQGFWLVEIKAGPAGSRGTPARGPGPTGTASGSRRTTPSCWPTARRRRSRRCSRRRPPSRRSRCPGSSPRLPFRRDPVRPPGPGPQPGLPERPRAGRGPPGRKGILAALINREVAGHRPGSPGRDRRPDGQGALVPGAWSRPASGRRSGPAGWATTCSAADRRGPGSTRTGSPSTPRCQASSAGSGSTRSPRPPARRTASGCGGRRPASSRSSRARPPRHPPRPRLQGPRERPGPAVRLRPRAVRLDHYLATRGARAHPGSGWSCSARSPTPSATPTASGSSTGRWRRRASWSRTPTPTSPGSRSTTGRSASARPSRPPAPRSTSRIWSIARPSSTWRPRRCCDPARRRPRRRTSSRWGPSPSTCSPPGRRREPDRAGQDPAGAEGAEHLRRPRRCRAEAGRADPVEHPPRRRPPDRLGRGLPRPARRRRGRADRPRHARASSTRCRPSGATGSSAASSSSGSSARGRPASPCWSARATRSSSSRSRATTRTTPGSTTRPRPCGRSTASSSSPCTRSARSAAGPCWCWRRRATRRWPTCSARRAGWAWSCSPGTATTCSRRSPRWSGTGSPTGTSSPTTSASARGKQRNQLVLFDFSLSRVPVDNIQVGTQPYLDPFLVEPQAAAVGPGGGAVLGGGDALRDGHGRRCPSGATASPTRR